MALSDFLFGSPERTLQINRFSPEQMQGINQLLSSLQGGLQNTTSGFAPIEQQARTQFQTSTIPSIAERFTSLGSGSQRSSAFQNALGGAGAGLEQSLASLRSQYGMQRENQLQNLLAQLLTTPQFETERSPATQGFLGGAGNILLALAPYLYGGGALGAPASIGLGSAGGGLGALSNYLRG